MATAELAPQDPQHLIDRFVARFGPAYRHLAAHAALPLVLTPDLLHYLRNAFLRGQVPWLAEADLLLSDLCKEVGYEQYAMHPGVRARLIAELKGQPNGSERIKEVARLLLQYLHRLRRSGSIPGSDALREQQWSALAYLDSERVSDDIQEALAALVERLQARPQDLDALASLAKITQNLAPQLDQNPELLELARDITSLITGDSGPPDGSRGGPAPGPIAITPESPKDAHAIHSPGDLVSQIASTFREWSDRVGRTPSPTEAVRPSATGTSEEVNAKTALKLVVDLTYFRGQLEEAARQGLGGMMQEANHQITNLEKELARLMPPDQLLGVLIREQDALRAKLEGKEDDSARSELMRRIDALEKEITRLAGSSSRTPSEVTGEGRAKAFDILLFYAPEDEKQALLLRNALETKGLHCWNPNRDLEPGGLSSRRIIGAISSSRVALLILTPASNASNWVHHEIAYVRSEGIPILSIRLEEVEPSQELSFLNEIQSLDGFPPPLEDHLPRIVEGIERALKRQVDGVPPRDSRPSATRIKILLLNAIPTVTRLQFEEESRAVAESVRTAELRDAVEVIATSNARLVDLQRLLLQHRPQILQITGFGSLFGEMILADDESQMKSVSGPTLAMLLRRFGESVRVVLFTDGYTQTLAREITEVIECTIGTSESMSHQAALVFTSSFYQAIGHGRSIQEAFNLANSALLLEGFPDKNTPVLRVRAGVDASRVVLTNSVERGEPDRTDHARRSEPSTDRIRGKFHGGRRMVLQAVRDLEGESTDYVDDAQVAERTRMALDDVRDWLELLEGQRCIERTWTGTGVSAYVTAKGKQTLRLYDGRVGAQGPAPEATSASPPSGTSPEYQVLHAIHDLVKDSAGFVTDADVAERTRMALDDVKDYFLVLEENEHVELARTTAGLSAYVTAKGRLALKNPRSYGGPPGPPSRLRQPSVPPLESQERLVLQAVGDLTKDSTDYVTDAQVAERTRMAVEDVRDWLEVLDGQGYIEVARMAVGLSAYVTAKGRLTLRRAPGPELQNSPRPVSKRTQDPASLAYAYSYKDEALRDELEEALALLKRQGLISGWHDRMIGAGDEWKGAIDKNLEEAQLILFLVSASFLASDYCWDVEMKRALERHDRGQARVIPVILRPCDWQGAPFGKLQSSPKDGKAISSWKNRDEAWTDVAKAIRRAVNERFVERERGMEGVSAYVTTKGIPAFKMTEPIPETTGPIRLFYSYSHKDKSLRDELEEVLALLKRQGHISGWHDRMIGAGEEWKGQIDKNLEESQIILLLISPSFLASDYCYDIETKRALDRHDKGEATVIPVLLRPVDWEGAPFARLQGLPIDLRPVTTWTNKDEAFKNIAQGIRRAIEGMRNGTR
jgi:transcription initiation factor IIE alpha subunit